MVGPARKREAVGHLQCELEMSQRRACNVVGQPRATQRHTPKPDAEEERLRERLNEFSRQRPRAGYRTASCHGYGGCDRQRHSVYPWPSAGCLAWSGTKATLHWRCAKTPRYQ